MPTYNLLEYSDNYSMTSGSLWNYYRNEVDDDENETGGSGNKINSNKIATSKSFKYKTKIIWITPDYVNRLNAEVAVPLKYLNNIWKSLDLPLINCKIELDLSWVRNCLISEVSRRFTVVPNAYPVAYEVVTQTTNISNK